MTKSTTIDFSIARLTAAAIAFPAATATTETELAMVKYGITAGAKWGPDAVPNARKNVVQSVQFNDPRVQPWWRSFTMLLCCTPARPPS